MNADPSTLGQWLALAALITATIRYAALIRARADRRSAAVAAAFEADTIGLYGLVRVFA